MISLVMLGAATALVAEADARNVQFANCVFAESRSVSVDVEENVFVDRLQANCAAEREALQDAFIAVHQARGDSREDAEARWSAAQQRGIDSVLNARRNIRARQMG